MLILIVITVPFSILINSICIIVLAANWLFDKEIFNKLARVSRNKLFYLFVALYLLQVIGLLNSSDIDDAFKKLEIKLSLGVLPLIMLSSPKLTKIQLNYILISFVIAVYLASLVSFSIPFFEYFNNITTALPSMTSFTQVLNFGHPYFGMYIVFAILCLLFVLQQSWSSLSIFLKISHVVALFFLYIFLLLIGARTAFYGSLFIGIIQISSFLYKKENLKKYLWIVPTFVSLIGIIIVNNQSIKNRISSVFETDLAYNPLYIKSLTWLCGLEIIADNLIFGVGTGDAQPYLKACYMEKKFWGANYEFNAHNEYIEEGVRHGIIGVIVFLLGILVPLYYCIKYKHNLYLNFLLLFIICCTTESILSSNKGVIFYAFFNSLFAAYYFQNEFNLSKDI